MPRSDRLLRLVQSLRRHRNPVTAEALAEELRVSVRTIYRDIGSLIETRVPIRGEAGVGYVLEPGFDLPPMMFSADEVEAILIGLRWTRGRADPTLARAADDVMAKIGAVLPKELRPVLLDGSLLAPSFDGKVAADSIDVSLIRTAIRRNRKLAIVYLDADGRTSQRTIWPFALAYFEAVRVVLGWCELRNGFRHFRTDRISAATPVDLRYPQSRAALFKRWEAQEMAKARGEQR